MQLIKKKIILVAKQKPLHGQTKGAHRNSGRNNLGRLTVRHQGSGVKQLYRNIDWCRNVENIMIINFEYDPNRSANLAKVAFLGKKRQTEQDSFGYILSVKGMTIFDKLQTIVEQQRNIFLKNGDASILKNFEPGDFLSCVEAISGKGGVYARSAGTYCQVLQSSASNYVKLRLPSGSQRFFSPFVKATLGIISNQEHNQRNLKKAGRNRWLNWRPTVRGVAMNPIDHPHGGGQGKTKGGRPSVTPRSLPTKGHPTRNPRKKNRFILKTN